MIDAQHLARRQDSRSRQAVWANDSAHARRIGDAGSALDRAVGTPIDATALPQARRRGPLDRAWRRLYAAALQTLFRATHPADQRHSERLWPHGDVVRDEADRVTHFRFHGRAIPLANAALSAEREAEVARHADLKGIVTTVHPASPTLPPLHLIACGPSIADIDYATLDAAAATHKRLGVNGAIALTQRHGMRFDYYCITDSAFIRQRENLAAQVIAQDLVLFTTPVCLWAILQRFPASALRCRVFLMERVGQPALRAPESCADVVARSRGNMTSFATPKPLGFSHDIARGVFPGGTVAFEALQVAAWLGHGDVYLHGIDLGNAAEQPRFYESEEDRLPTFLHRQLDSDILPSFRHAALILRAKRVRVTNLSLDSALDRSVFPKADWRTLPFVLGHAVIARAQQRSAPAGVRRSDPQDPRDPRNPQARSVA